MTDQEILQKTIEKVAKAGWLGNPTVEWNIHEAGVDGHWLLCLPNRKTKTKIHYNIEAVIFDHGFAKAFWGHEETCWKCGLFRAYLFRAYTDKSCCGFNEVNKVYKPAWQYHLQQMVLEENPIKYLEKFL